MTEEGNPEWFYHPFFVTPAIFKPGSTVFKNLGALLDFRHDKKTSPRSERDGLESLRGESEGESIIKGAAPPLIISEREKLKT